jgi:hypothetical protein
MFLFTQRRYLYLRIRWTSGWYIKNKLEFMWKDAIVTSGAEDKWPLRQLESWGTPYNFQWSYFQISSVRRTESLRKYIQFIVRLGGSPTRGASDPETSAGNSPTPLFVTSYHALSTELGQRSLSLLRPVLSLRTFRCLHPLPLLFYWDGV